MLLITPREMPSPTSPPNAHYWEHTLQIEHSLLYQFDMEESLKCIHQVRKGKIRPGTNYKFVTACNLLCQAGNHNNDIFFSLTKCIFTEELK